MTENLENLQDLYHDAAASAALVGLAYLNGDAPGITRVKRGTGFSYRDEKGHTVQDKTIRSRIDELVIPPAWQEVWISNDERSHILATGIDEKGRKQYIYHPKWRTMRDLLKFYRLIIFGNALPKIRRIIEEDLARTVLDREKVLGIMLWLLDNTYLRVGNDIYLAENDSRGLTTLSDKNLVAAGPVVTLSFRGKSGKEQQITFDDARIAKIIEALTAQRGSRLFRYKQNGGYVNIEPEHINAYLHEVTGQDISAKDFRTWGGTLMAFNHLVETEKLPDDKTPKPEKSVVAAVDAAANVLGNTRAVAKSSYVHPDILDAYLNEKFTKYYTGARHKPTKPGLDKRETELLAVLAQLFDNEFDLLRKN